MPIIYEFPSQYSGVHKKGPFKDGNGNLYMIGFEHTDLYSSKLYAFKSTTSGSTWTEIATKTTNYGGNCNMGKLSANEDQIIVPVYWGLFDNDYVIYVYTFQTSSNASPDVWSSTVPSHTAYAYGTSGLPGDAIVPLATCQQANNNYSVLYTDSVLISGYYYSRPLYMKCVSGTATWDQELYSYSSSDASNYFPCATGLQIDGRTIFLWAHTDSNIAYKTASSTYSLGSLYTSSLYGYSFAYAGPEMVSSSGSGANIAFTNIWGSYNDLLTVTSGSVITNEDLPNAYSYGYTSYYTVRSRPYSSDHPDYLMLFYVGKDSMYGDNYIKYKTKLRDATSWSDWLTLDEETSGSVSGINDMRVIDPDVYWLEGECLHKFLFPTQVLTPASARAVVVNPTVEAINYYIFPVLDKQVIDTWIADDGLTTNLWNHLNENMPDNNTWIYSLRTSGSNTSYAAELGPSLTSGSPWDNYYLGYSYFLYKDPLDIGNYPTLKVTLREAFNYVDEVTIIATWEHTNITSEIPTSVVQHLTNEQAQSINWTSVNGGSHHLYLTFEVIDT